MGIRDNLIMKYARLRLAADVAGSAARRAGVNLTEGELQVARVAAAEAGLDYFRSRARGQAPDPHVTEAHIERAIKAIAECR